jgi:hypothetical protein
VTRHGGVGVALGVLVALTACSSSTAGPGLPSAAGDVAGPAATQTAPGEPATPETARPALGAGSTADDVRAAGRPLTSGALTLSLAPLGETVDVLERDDGSLVVTLDVPDAGAAAAVLAAPVGHRFERSADGSVAVLDAAGAYVGGLARPGVGGGGRAGGGTYVLEAPDLLRVERAPGTDRGATASTVASTVAIWFGTGLVEGLSWGEREGGRSLAVDPTDWARAAGSAAQEATWAAVIGAEPEADTPGMRAQFQCHALGAPDKASWNLEPWRPEVDGLEMLAARCNPT